MAEKEPPAAVILVCPCCASRQDALALDRAQVFECGECGQRWQMKIDAQRFDANALT